MSGQLDLRTTIAEPLQAEARQLRPIAEVNQKYVGAYNKMCLELDSYNEKLQTRTGKGLEKDWSLIKLNNVQ